MEMNRNDKLLAELYDTALKAVDPYDCVKRHEDKISDYYRYSNCKRIICAAFGKAACSMSYAFEEGFGNLIEGGIVITKYGHCRKHIPRCLKVFEAGHPLPDENGLQGTAEIVKLLNDADENTLIVSLISGGGSALLVAPFDGITLEEKQKITALLLKSGADIYELNTIRKHISKIKGGRLAEIAYPARVISLILSDVIGNRLDVIASGPTAPDRTTFQDALAVLEKYSLTDKIPLSVLDIFRRGSRSLIPETPKENSIVFRTVENIIIGSSEKALEAAKSKASELNLHAKIISEEITGEARDIGKWLAKAALEARDTLVINKQSKICLISGGETTVTVKGTGTGGRNMELALAFAIEIEGISGITLLSAGTDGTDGPTDAAGAIVDGNTVLKARTVGIDPLEYLRNNDSYNFFRKIDDLFITGPTGTNVMDIQLILIEQIKIPHI